MAIETVAIFAPGDMGHAIARVLVASGIRVTTNLADRSERTRDLAARAGIDDTGDDVSAVDGADLLFAILPPAKAVELAQRLASALATIRTRPIYVELNATAPASAVEIGGIIEGVGVPFVDGGIVGAPPKAGQGMGPRLYVSGHDDDISRVRELRDAGLDVRPVPGGVGAASALKMSYAALTKGLTALAVQSLVAARAYGVDRELDAELVASLRMLRERFDRTLPEMAPKAYRWVGEMEEIARTFADIGLDPKLFLGAAETYRLVSETALGREVADRRNLGLTADEVAGIIAAALQADLSREAAQRG